MRPANQPNQPQSFGFSTPNPRQFVRAQFLASLSLFVILMLALLGTGLFLASTTSGQTFPNTIAGRAQLLTSFSNGFQG